MIVLNRVKSAEDLAKQLLLATDSGDRTAIYPVAKCVAEQVSKHSSSDYKKDIYIAALLYKTGKEKYLAADKKPLPLSYIEKFFGTKVINIVKELQTAPANHDDLSLWAKTLSPEAQEILMAESTAVNIPETAKSITITTALKEVNPKLYTEAQNKCEKTSPFAPFSFIKRLFGNK